MTELEVFNGQAAVAVPTQAAMRREAMGALGDWAEGALAAYEVAKGLVMTSFVPVPFRDKPYEATAAILAGAEVGLSPMSSLRSFDVIQGQAAPRAITLRAIVQSQGHEIRLVESTQTRAIVEGRRRGSSQPERSIWTLDRAKDAGLTGKDNWRKQPGAMLVARATAEVCRLIAADAILGIAYTSEELADGAEPLAGGDVPVESEAPRTRRMSRARPAPPPADDTQPEPEAPKLSEEQRAKMFAGFNELGITDREQRLAWIGDVVGRDVESSNNLTVGEASTVIDRIESTLARPFAKGDRS